MSPSLRQFRAVARWALSRLLWMTGALDRAKRTLVDQDAILVLTLHRVLTADERKRAFSEDAIVVSRENFEALTSHLAEHFDVARLSDLTGGSWPANSRRPRVAVTFDDGWQDNYQPVLDAVAKHRTPVTIFVCSGLTGRHSPFWPEHVRGLLADASEAERQQTIASLKRLPRVDRDAAIETLAEKSAHRLAPRAGSPDATMSWQTLETLNRAGVAIESHAKSHEILTTLDAADLERELVESRDELSGRLARPVRILAYPNGNHSPQVRQAARAAGYSLGLAVGEGLWTKTSDRFAIPRVNVSDSRLSDFGGKFSAIAFEYAVIWRAVRAFEKAQGAPQQSVNSPAAGRVRQPE